MSGYKGNRNKRDGAQLLLRRILLGILVFVSLAGCVSVWNAYHKEQESLVLRHDSERELAALQKREQTLRRDIMLFKTDRGKEELLRSQYSLAREGEQTVIIVDGPAPVATQASSTDGGMQGLLRRVFPWW